MYYESTLNSAANKTDGAQRRTKVKVNALNVTLGNGNRSNSLYKFPM